MAVQGKLGQSAPHVQVAVTLIPYTRRLTDLCTVTDTAALRLHALCQTSQLPREAEA